MTLLKNNYIDVIIFKRISLFYVLEKSKESEHCSTVFINRKCLKAISPIKDKTNNQTFQRKNTNFWNHF